MYLKRVSLAALTLTVLCGAFLTSSLTPACADQAEVREIARNNNCPPKKIDIFQQTLGSDGQTIYKVTCTLPKTVGASPDSAKGPDSLLISCRDTLCQMLRPYTDEKK